jgi:hypothetical protein
MPSLIGRFIAVATLLFFAASLRTPLAWAQNSAAGTLTGLIVDEANSPIAGAIATITNLGTGNTDSRRTDATGRYRFDYKPAGRYRVEAEKEGYVSYLIESYLVQLNYTNIIELPRITLRRVAGITPPDRLESLPPSLVNTADASRGGNFSQREFDGLPIGGATVMRSFDEYAFLLPGVAPPPYTPGLRGPGIGYGIGTAGEFSVNGQRARSNNFTVDGSDNNDPDVGVRRQGFIALVPQSIESIQDFHVSTQLWDTEQGRNVGSLVNAVSKDGSNTVHGQVYGFLTDDGLNARNFFDKTGFAGDHEYNRGQVGAVIGAPIKRDRTHIFGSFEHLNITERGEQHFAVPRFEERSLLGLKRFGVFQPTTDFLPNEFIARRGGRTAIGKNILSLVPEPNNPGGPFGDNTFTQILSSDGDGNIGSVKLNHEFATGRVLNARYNLTDDSRTLPSINRAINSTTEASTRTQDVSVIYESQYGDRLSNQARFSYGRTRLDLFLPAGTRATFSAQSDEQVNNPNNTVSRFISQTGEIGELDIEPFSPVGVNAFLFPQNRANNTFQYADSMTWTFSDHSLKFGADIRRIQLNSRLDRNYRAQVVYGGGLLTTGVLNGFVNFTPDFTAEKTVVISGVELAALGLPSSIFQTVTQGTPDSTVGLRFTESNLFFNDSWRLSREFKLDYGVRYEYNSVPQEVNRRVEEAIGLQTIPTPGNTPANTRARTDAFNAAVDAYSGVLDGRKGIYEPDRNNVGGHISFAWNPDGRGRMAIRGGYGVYYDAILGAVVSQSRNVFPNEIPLNVEPAFASFDIFTLNSPAFFRLQDPNNSKIDIPLIRAGSGNQFGGSPEEFVAAIGALLLQNRGGGGLAFTLPEKHLRTPYAQQWNFTIEREIFGDYAVSLAYVGNKGTKLTRLTTPNLGPNVTPSIQMANAGRGALSSIAFPIIFSNCQAPPYNGRCSIQPPRPLADLGAYQLFSNSANSSYQALQIESRKHYAHGYTFSIAYTYSHAIDDVSDVFPIAGAPILPQNSFNLPAERGDASFDVRHLFSSSIIWDLPFWRNNTSGLGRALGGWQVATFAQAHTGQPFTLNIPVDANGDGNLTDRPSTTDGLIFFDGHHRQRVSQVAPTTSFFGLGRDGAIGRNTARGDSYVNLDLALNKNVVFTDRQRMMFRFEVFNVLNRANFGLPLRTIGAPGFGSALETVNPARLIQFALKYQF